LWSARDQRGRLNAGISVRLRTVRRTSTTPSVEKFHRRGYQVKLLAYQRAHEHHVTAGAEIDKGQIIFLDAPWPAAAQCEDLHAFVRQRTL
jgi:hypothetical protein